MGCRERFGIETETSCGWIRVSTTIDGRLFDLIKPLVPLLLGKDRRENINFLFVSVFSKETSSEENGLRFVSRRFEIYRRVLTRSLSEVIPSFPISDRWKQITLW